MSSGEHSGGGAAGRRGRTEDGHVALVRVVEVDGGRQVLAERGDAQEAVRVYLQLERLHVAQVPHELVPPAHHRERRRRACACVLTRADAVSTTWARSGARRQRVGATGNDGVDAADAVWPELHRARVVRAPPSDDHLVRCARRREAGRVERGCGCTQPSIGAQRRTRTFGAAAAGHSIHVSRCTVNVSVPRRRPLTCGGSAGPSIAGSQQRSLKRTRRRTRRRRRSC